jgi:carotenoid 1,2-hydratase
VIAFVGGVFSPRYARARRSGRGDPERHCAVNVALYGDARRWSYTERGAASLARTPDAFALGASRFDWDGAGLTITLDEVGAPLPRRIRGRIRIEVDGVAAGPHRLDDAGRHRWHPIAPAARARVRLDAPRIAFDGTAYVDANDGDEPLERAFAGWHWSRARVGDRTIVAYDCVPRDGARRSLALAFDAAGRSDALALPPLASLPRTRWRLSRAARCDIGATPTVHSTLEDTPFYARSLVDTMLGGTRAIAMHETLSLDRYAEGWVRALLPVRMRRG